MNNDAFMMGYTAKEANLFEMDEDYQRMIAKLRKKHRRTFKKHPELEEEILGKEAARGDQFLKMLAQKSPESAGKIDKVKNMLADLRYRSTLNIRGELAHPLGSIKNERGPQKYIKAKQELKNMHPEGRSTIDALLSNTTAKDITGHNRGYTGQMKADVLAKLLSKNAKESKSDKKVGKVMGEFKRGELHSGSKTGPKVTNRKQAIAIAMSEAGKSKK